MIEQGSKYNVAWFKLAEFVWRREREKAHAICKLLSHSFQDVALSHQLEGDIHLSFEDREKAIQSYQKAADLYLKNGNPQGAVALFDHLILLDSQSIELAIKRFKAYFELQASRTLYFAARAVCALLINSRTVSQYARYAREYELSTHADIYLSEQLVLSLIEAEMDEHMIVERLNNALDAFHMYDQSQITSFLSKIRALNERFYEAGLEYVQTNKSFLL